MLANQAAKMAVDIQQVCQNEDMDYTMTLNIHSHDLQIETFDTRKVDSVSVSDDHKRKNMPTPQDIQIQIEASEKNEEGSEKFEVGGDNLDLEEENDEEPPTEPRPQPQKKASQNSLNPNGKYVMSPSKSVVEPNSKFVKKTPRNALGGVLGRKISNAQSKVNSRRKSS